MRENESDALDFENVTNRDFNRKNRVKLPNFATASSEIKVVGPLEQIKINEESLKDFKFSKRYNKRNHS